MKNKELFKELKKKMVKQVGRRCKDYHPLCYICMCWHAYLVLKEASRFWEEEK